MSSFCKLLILASLTYGMITGDIPKNDPVVIPVIIDLVNQIDKRDRDSDK